MCKITVVLSLKQALDQLRSINGRAYGYYLGMSKKNGRNKNYVKVINKIYL